MKIAFRVDSGAGVGMGHLTRMSALADAFSLFGIESIFFQSADEPINYTGFDIVILDSYLLSDEYIDALNSEERLLVCYDDNALYTYSCDVLVNANLHAETLSYRFGNKKPELLLGGKYALLRREFWDATPIEIHEAGYRVLLTFGGTDINNFTVFAIDALKDIPNIQIKAVFGPLAEGFETCKDNFRGYNYIDLLKDPPSMASVMQGCDMAIASASSTVYELAAFGIPAVIIPQADNQCLIAEYLAEHNLMKSLGWWKEVPATLLCEETKALVYNRDRRTLESNRLEKSVNPKGAQYLVKKIMEYKNATS